MHAKLVSKSQFINIVCDWDFLRLGKSVLKQSVEELQLH